MKVGIVNTVFGRHPFGGPAIHGWNQARAFKQAGLNVTTFYGGEVHPDYAKGLEDVIRPVEEFDPWDYDVIMVQCGWDYIFDMAIKGYKNIIAGSNVLPNAAPEHCFPYLDAVEQHLKMLEDEKKLMARLISCTRAWVAQSRFQRREYWKLGLPFDMPVHIIPNPVDTDGLFKFAKADELGDAVIWSGKDTWAKNPLALAKVAKQLPDVKFIAISDHSLRAIFPDNVEIITGGTIFDVAKILRRGRIFLSTSVTENNPLAVLEAMSVGLVPIGFKTSGMTEIITDDFNGVLVSLNNIGHLKLEIEHLLQNEERWGRLRQKARETTEAINSYKTIAIKYKRLFRKIVEMDIVKCSICGRVATFDDLELCLDCYEKARQLHETILGWNAHLDAIRRENKNI